MSRFKRIVYILAPFFLIVSMEVPLVFASGVDAANAGVEALNQGDRKKAKVLFKSALESNELTKKNYIIVNNKLCKVLWSESKMAEAIDCFSESLYLSPDDSLARLSRGTLYKEIGQYRRAIKDISKYIVLFPRDDRGYTCRGLSHWALKENDKAISDLSRAASLRPGNGNSYILRGNIYFETGHYNLAMADFEKAVRQSPQSASAYQALAWFYATCPNRDFRQGVKAVGLTEKALEAENSDSPRSNILETLAASYAETGRFQEAVHAQEQAMALVRAGIVDWVASRETMSHRLDLYKSGKPYRGMRASPEPVTPGDKQTGKTKGSANGNALADPLGAPGF